TSRSGPNRIARTRLPLVDAAAPAASTRVKPSAARSARTVRQIVSRKGLPTPAPKGAWHPEPADEASSRHDRGTGRARFRARGRADLDDARGTAARDSFAPGGRAALQHGRAALARLGCSVLHDAKRVRRV